MSGHSAQATLLYIGSEIERLGECLEASDQAMKDAVRLTGRVLRSDYEYSSVDSVASACFYLACQRQDEPISLPDVADKSRKDQKNVQHLATKLISELGIELTPTEPDTYLDDVLDHFDLSEGLREEAFEILDRAKERQLHVGMAPTTVAGAILYGLVEKHDVGLTQQDIADAVNKTTVSIRNNYVKFLQLADDVPVDALPPQTFDEAFAKLDSHFDENPRVYVKEAQELLDEANVSHGSSRAGVAGAAYYVASNRNGSGLTCEAVSEAVGVTPSTVSRHTRWFDNE